MATVLLLTEEDVRRLLTMEMALEAVELGLRKLALEEASNIPRARCYGEHALLHLMGASLGASSKVNLPSVMGAKVYGTSRQGSQFLVTLFDGRTGQLLALLQADYLGQVRTGAASGVATHLMARSDAAVVGVLGSGKQARTQLQAICKVRKIRLAQVYSPNEPNRRAFAHDMSELCQTEVVAVARPESAAEDKDIVITATSSREPVLNGAWLAQGCHINAIGSNFLTKAEVDAATFRRCVDVVVDSKDQARLEAGDFVQALEDGVLHWSDIRELGQVLVGRFPVRRHAQDITLFKSLGLAIEDVVLAARVVARAKEEGVGRFIEW